MSGSMKTKVISSPFNEPLDPEKKTFGCVKPNGRPKRREKAARCFTVVSLNSRLFLHVSSSNRLLIEASLAFRVPRP
jgi:hypothetical protein